MPQPLAKRLIPHWSFGLLAVVVVGAYAPSWNRGFVSEDLVFLRLFHEANSTSLSTAVALALRQFTGPWLGLEIVGFYRPLTSLVLQLQEAVFGTWSGGYLLVALGLHLFCVAQVRWLCLAALHWGASDGHPSCAVRASGCTSARHQLHATLAAAAFALYPLHPNSIVFIVSLATPLCVAAVLSSLRFFVSARRTASLLAFLVGLGCYEQAVVLVPGLFLIELLRQVGWALSRHHSGPESPAGGLLSAARGRPAWNTSARRLAPYVVVGAAYLVLRSWALDAVVGGYSSFLARLSQPDLVLTSLVSNLGNLLWPSYHDAQLAEVLGAVVLASLLASVLLLAWRHAVPYRAPVWLWCAGLCWIVASLMPFLLVGVVPGNGRYFSLGAAGLALAALSASLAAEHLVRRAGLLLLGGYAAGLLVLLWAAIPLHVRAAETVDAAASAVRSLPVSDADGGVTLHFIAGVPGFVQLHGVPAAQVLHWGLADLGLPPWSPRTTLVFPLPDLSLPELAPLAVQAGRRGWQLHRWREGSLEGVALPAPEPQAMESFDVTVVPSPGSSTAPHEELGEASGGNRSQHRQSPTEVRWQAPAREANSYELVVLTRGAVHRQVVTAVRLESANPPARAVQRDVYEVALPATLMHTMVDVYPSHGAPTALWWVIERGPQGNVLAASRLHEVQPSAAL